MSCVIYLWRIEVWAMNWASLFTFQVVAVYHGRTNSFNMQSDLIHWPNREGLGPPGDQPECGFNGQLCETSKALMSVAKSL